MEQKKAKLGMSALKILGIVYTLLGGVFTVLGVTLAAVLWEEDVRLVGILFGGIGSIFLVLGILFLAVEAGKKRRANRILASGRYVWGEVIDIIPDFSVRINGRCGYHILVGYTDMYGVRHVFKSPNQRIIRDPDLFGRKVKVYMEDDSYKHYYVDADGILSNVVEH